MKFNASELATILAALRNYQQQGLCDPAKRSPDLDDIATNGGTVAALSAEEIDTLCENLNCSAG